MIKAENAVILAAGTSSRFVPLCFDIPKGLLKVKGNTLIERQIYQLKEVGVNDIFIVTGNFAEQFKFLEQKEHVQLIYNSDFGIKNNYSSFYAAREVLSDTIISSSDLFFSRNIFQSETNVPYYASVFSSEQTNHRALTVDNTDMITSVTYGGKNVWITYGGHAFLSKEISKMLLNYIESVYDNPEFYNKYWVDFHDNHITEIPMYIKHFAKQDILEFNTLEALRAFDSNFVSVSISPIMHFLCECLEADEKELSSFTPIKKDNYAVGFYFIYHGNKYKYLTQTKHLEKVYD